MRRFSVFVSITIACLLSAPSARAQNILERILTNPKIQVLISKPAEITGMLGLCKNQAYQRANTQPCLDASNAEMVLKLPFEMRILMSNPKSAQSMRDLCIAAQSTAQRDSYLCAELAKADSIFASVVQGIRTQDAASRMNDLSN